MPRIVCELPNGCSLSVPAYMLGLTEKQLEELSKSNRDSECWLLPRMAMSQIAWRLWSMKTMGGTH